VLLVVLSITNSLKSRQVMAAMWQFPLPDLVGLFIAHCILYYAKSTSGRGTIKSSNITRFEFNNFSQKKYEGDMYSFFKISRPI
jgi:hypothetical protein